MANRQTGDSDEQSGGASENKTLNFRVSPDFKKEYKGLPCRPRNDDDRTPQRGVRAVQEEAAEMSVGAYAQRIARRSQT